MKTKCFLSIVVAFSFAVLSPKAFGSNNDVNSSRRDSITEAVIDVEYKKTGKSGIVWKDELELARVLPTLDGKGIRITLPNSEPARVIILDKKGKKSLKTISYVAPAVIDISDLKKGEYQLILESHQVTVVKQFRKVRR